MAIDHLVPGKGQLGATPTGRTDARHEKAGLALGFYRIGDERQIKNRQIAQIEENVTGPGIAADGDIQALGGELPGRRRAVASGKSTIDDAVALFGEAFDFLSGDAVISFAQENAGLIEATDATLHVELHPLPFEHSFRRFQLYIPHGFGLASVGIPLHPVGKQGEIAFFQPYVSARRQRFLLPVVTEFIGDQIDRFRSAQYLIFSKRRSGDNQKTNKER